MENLVELEARARDTLSVMLYDYVAGGAGEERTVRENEEAWKRLALRPHVLRDVANVSVATSVLARGVRTPLVVAPMGYHGLFHPEGEVATARGAARAGSGMVAPMRSTTSLERIVAETGQEPAWFQVYMHPDRNYVAEIVHRAAAAGYGALVVTVDVPVRGNRSRFQQEPFRLPDDLPLPHLPGSSQPGASRYDVAFDPRATAETLVWLRELSALPIIVKGVVRGDDARRCIDAGASAVIVSNHGGRQLDTVVASAEALPEVVEAVGERAEVYIDGGIRSGTDIAKALALGARAVLIGRPAMWGLATGGAQGVFEVLTGLANDLARTMALLGVTEISDLRTDLVRHPSR